MKKQVWIFIGITGIFICLLIGVFIGRNTTRNYISVDNALQAPVTEPTEDTQNHDGKINLNTATKQQLMLLPGIGETTAQKIIDYRTEHNGFTLIEDIMNVNGIGEKKFKQMKPYIKVE